MSTNSLGLPSKCGRKTRRIFYGKCRKNRMFVETNRPFIFKSGEIDSRDGKEAFFY